VPPPTVKPVAIDLVLASASEHDPVLQSPCVDHVGRSREGQPVAHHSFATDWCRKRAHHSPAPYARGHWVWDHWHHPSRVAAGASGHHRWIRERLHMGRGISALRSELNVEVKLEGARGRAVAEDVVFEADRIRCRWRCVTQRRCNGGSPARPELRGESHANKRTSPRLVSHRGPAAASRREDHASGGKPEPTGDRCACWGAGGLLLEDARREKLPTIAEGASGFTLRWRAARGGPRAAPAPAELARSLLRRRTQYRLSLSSETAVGTPRRAR
jgi:hypothetical protein